MRRAEPWLIAISLAGGLIAAAPQASAQQGTRTPVDRTPGTRTPVDRTPGDHAPNEHDRRRPPQPADGPREAPPTPREERQAARAGYEWLSGRWEWRHGKWDWTAGRWERERPGKHWSPGRWDKQGDLWVYVDGAWVDGNPTPPPPPSDRPREAPPPPRDEHPNARPGYVFARGHWEWRGGTWAWQDGRWERERPGQQWREARWELRDGTYAMIDGEWVNVGPASGQPPPPTDRPDRPDRRTWRLERPTVSSYWPIKGKIGSRITIRGRNFPADTAVLWGSTQVNGAKVTPSEIIVAVPPGATSGTIMLRAGGRRELIVGNYEVAADYDAAAEAARVAEAARAQAERDWIARQRLQAKDRAARLAAYERHREEREQTREQRRAQWLSEVRARWEAAFLADAETQDELTLHAQRSADLSRMREVAELSENGKLVIRIGVAQSREDERHTTRMAALHDSFRRTP